MQDGVVVLPLKSTGVAALLAALFGPLGLLYASLTAGLIMMGLTAIAGLLGVLYMAEGLTLSLDFFSLWLLLMSAAIPAQIFVAVTWPVCIVWAIIGARAHNRKLLYETDDDLWS